METAVASALINTNGSSLDSTDDRIIEMINEIEKNGECVNIDDKYAKGIFELLIDVNYGKKVPSKLTVEVELVNKNEDAKFEVNKLYVEEFSKKELVAKQKSEGHSSIRFKKILDRVEAWSAEKPTLYDMTIRLKDKKGKVIDCTQKGYTLGEKVIRFSKVVVGE